MKPTASLESAAGSKRRQSMKISTRELVLFSLLGAIMFVTKAGFEIIPNVHPLAMLTVAYTVQYRKKALYPIYVFVFLTCLYAGFNLWCIPYFYLWTILWAVAMVLPRNLPVKFAVPMYMIVCSLHGFLYGTLYAPAQAIMFGLNFQGMLAWIVAGLPYDAIHGVSNFFVGSLVLPTVKVLKRAEYAASKSSL